MRIAIIIAGVAVVAAGIGFLAVLYGVGREMNMHRTCGRGGHR